MNIFKKSKTAKVLATIVGLAAGFTMTASVATAAGLTAGQVSAILTMLEEFGADSATINNVQVALTGEGTTVPTSGTCSAYTFSKNLTVGNTGADVKALQVLLNKDVATQVAATGVGSAGNESEYFGPMTKAAVVKLQNKYAADVLTPIGLTAGTGYVGSMTLAKLNELSTCTVADEPGDVTGFGTAATFTLSGTPVASDYVYITLTDAENVVQCAADVLSAPAGVTLNSLTDSLTTKFGNCANFSASSNGNVITVVTTGASFEIDVDVDKASGSTLGIAGVITEAASTEPAGNVVTGPVTVVAAASNPSGALIGLQAGAKVADLEFKGNGTVTSVTLKQSGFSTQDALTAVYLYDGSTRLTDGYTFNSAGNIVMNNLNIAVAGSRVISVKVDVMATPAGTQSTVVVSLVGYTADGTAETVQVDGGLFQFVSSSLAGVALGGANTVGTPTVNAGTMNYTVWGNSLNISTRAVKLGGGIFKVIGSAPGTSLENAKLMVDGVQAGDAVGVDASGNVVFNFTATPVTLATGSHTIELRADIVGGSNRSFYVSLGSVGDLVLADSQYTGANIAIGATGYVALNYNSGVITIGPGTISLTKDTTFDASTDVTSGASNIAIAKYKIKAYGEDMKVKQFSVTVTETADEGLNNIGVYVNGAQVGSPQSIAAGASLAVFSLGSSLIIPVGTEVTVEIRADLTNAAGAAFAGTIVTDINVPTSQAQGMSSQSLTSAVSPGTTSVTSAAVTATVAEDLAVSDATVAGNSTNKLVGSYVIQAGATEGVRVTNIAIGLTADGTATSTSGYVETTDLANLTISIDGGEQMTPVNPLATNNFSVDFTIAKGTSKTVKVYADVTAATNGETIDTTILVTLRGSVSNTAITSGNGIASALAGQTMTVGSGTLATLTVVSAANTTAQYLIGGSNAQAIINYGVTSTGGDSTIQEMTFDIGTSLTGAIVNIQAAGDKGGTSCSAPVVGTVITLRNCAIAVPQGYEGTGLAVTVNLGTVGVGGIASNGDALLDLRTVKYTNGVTSTTVNMDATTTPYLADVATSSVMKVVASKPKFVLTSSSNTMQNGETKVGTVTITAGTNGSVNLNVLPVTITISGGATLAASTTAEVLLVKEANTTIATTDNVVGDGVTSQAATLTFTNNFIVPKGTSRTLDIYAYFTSVTGGDDSAQISLVADSSLDWDDVVGNGSGLSGTLISDYPTNSVTVVD